MSELSHTSQRAQASLRHDAKGSLSSLPFPSKKTKPVSTSDGGTAKRRRISSLDEERRRDIRASNRIAARECRARKKNLVAELERTVANLTAEHSELMKQNREMEIRLDTLERSAVVGIAPAASAYMLPSMLASNPGFARPAFDNSGLLANKYQTQLQPCQMNPGTAMALGTKYDAPRPNPRIVINHMHHYGTNNQGGEVGGNGSPSLSPELVRASTSYPAFAFGRARTSPPTVCVSPTISSGPEHHGLETLASLAQMQSEAVDTGLGLGSQRALCMSLASNVGCY